MGCRRMRARAPFPLRDLTDLSLARPLLGFSRADLRDYLHALGNRTGWKIP